MTTPHGPHGPNEQLLVHPSGAAVHLLGTQHVATATHGRRAADAIAATQPHTVLLELDAARFQQVEFRLAAMMHADTRGLMALTNSSSRSDDSGTSSLTLQQRFKLARNEGVPLLLGSLYGADLAQAALAAATAVPGGGADIVLADQPQEYTRARFRALVADSFSLTQLLTAWLLPEPAQAEALVADAASSRGLAQQQAPGLQQLAQVATAAAQLAAGRLVHHLLLWASMACSSQARWYGDQVHPMFYLVGDPGLQDRLTARGCKGAQEAAAAATRLLQHARTPAAGGGMVSDAAVQDLQAIRRFVASLEALLWSVDDGACATGSSSGSSSGGGSGSSSGGGGTTQSRRGSAIITAASECFSSVAGGGGELLPLRPWWVQVSEAVAGRIGLSSSSGQQQAAAGSLSATLAGHQHANVTAAAAYELAVVAERNRVLTDALWQAAERAAAAAVNNAQQQHVVAVVGVNHVPGIRLMWEQRQQQAAASAGSSIFSSAGATPSADGGAFLPWQLAATDAAASVFELAAAGGAGLMWLAGVQRWGGGSAAVRAAAGSGVGVRRLGLLLLPAAAALLPLQREAGRMHEACHLLEQVAAVNDRMLQQELQQLHAPQANGAGSGGRGLLQLAFRAQAAAAAAAAGAGGVGDCGIAAT